jgi:hypothetical protein
MNKERWIKLRADKKKYKEHLEKHKEECSLWRLRHPLYQKKWRKKHPNYMKFWQRRKKKNEKRI